MGEPELLPTTGLDHAAFIAALARQIGDEFRSAMHTQASIGDAERLINKEWIADYFNVGASTCERIIATPGFPVAIKVPGGCLRWYAAEVKSWAASQRRTRGRQQAA